MYVIVLNQNNIVDNGENNTLVYKFPNSVLLTEKSIAVSQINMYYSWFNIDEKYSNNRITYTWTVGATTTTYTILIPNGLYEISDINKYFQFVMIENGHYLISPSGDFIYYFELVVNPNRYAIQLNTYDVPTSLPTGWTQPTNFDGYPTQPFNPSIIFLAKFNEIVGYPVSFSSNPNINGAYTPPAPTKQNNYVEKVGQKLSYLSNSFPNVQPNSSIYVALSNVNNPYSIPSSVIYSISPSVAIGRQIIDRPPNFMWNKMINGTYSEIKLQFLGQDNRPITIQDSQMSIMLVITDSV